MPSHASVAASVRARKARNPDLYCAADPRCLWLVRLPDGSLNPCRKHPAKQLTPQVCDTCNGDGRIVSESNYWEVCPDCSVRSA